MKTKPIAMTIEEMARHMPKEFDFTLVTLKGHLLIEAMLNDYISGYLRKPGVLLEKTRLPFDIKVKLAHALSGEQLDQHAWTAIDNLNKIRNSLAHRLTDKNLQNLRIEFVRLAQKTGYLPTPGGDDDAVYVGAVAFFAGMLRATTPGYDPAEDDPISGANSGTDQFPEEL